MEIIIGSISESDRKSNPNEKYLDFDGGENIWLKCTYDLSNLGITEVNFYYFRFDDSYLVINAPPPPTLTITIKFRKSQLNMILLQ